VTVSESKASQTVCVDLKYCHTHDTLTALGVDSPVVSQNYTQTALTTLTTLTALIALATPTTLGAVNVKCTWAALLIRVLSTLD
jgi:hypothetical protein